MSRPGRLDGFWEVGLAPWDTAAGILLISEAGGRIGNLAGGDYVDSGHLLAGTPRVYTALIEMLRAIPRRRASQMTAGPGSQSARAGLESRRVLQGG